MACCKACGAAQAAGTMPKGATCSPCANGSSGLAEIEECECPTLMLGRIDPIITARWEQSETDVDAITLAVLETVYPRTPDGRPIDWRSLSIDTATCLLELRRRVRVRVAACSKGVRRSASAYSTRYVASTSMPMVKSIAAPLGGAWASQKNWLR